jgi:hypothetical protein
MFPLQNKAARVAIQALYNISPAMWPRITYMSPLEGTDWDAKLTSNVLDIRLTPYDIDFRQ